MTDKEVDTCAFFLVETVFLFTLPFGIRWLWNLILVPACSFMEITYWQAFGLQFLYSFLRVSMSTVRVARIYEKLHFSSGGNKK